MDRLIDACVKLKKSRPLSDTAGNSIAAIQFIHSVCNDKCWLDFIDEFLKKQIQLNHNTADIRISHILS